MRQLPSLQSLRFPMPVSGWALAILLALFLLPGVTGHDPWKAEDAANFGIIWRSIGSGDWLTFRLVTDRIIEPPLFYWVAKSFTLALSGFLAAPDAARLATPLFAGATCYLLFATARELYGREAAAAAPMALAGSLGFLIVSHDTQPMIAALAGLSATYAGLTLIPRRQMAGAGLLGCGWAILVLAHGLTLLPAALLTAIVAILFADNRRNAVIGVLVGIFVALALVTPWALLTANFAPDALREWVSAELAQFGGAAPRLQKMALQAKLLAWFAWPVLPLAGWAIWNERHKLGQLPYALPLGAFILILANLMLVFEPRHLPTLATLPPLAILAASGMTSLRRGAANGFDWFGRMTFTVTAALLWLGWIAMRFGVPPRIAHNFEKLAPGFSLQFNLTALVVSAAATIAWLWLCLATSREPLRSLARWTSGIALLWLLAMLLWLPWIDYGKSYRSVATGIAQAIPSARDCIGARGLGESQYASLDYFLGRRLRSDADGASRCPYLVTQGDRSEKTPGGEWQKIWEGARPGDKSERIRVYVSRTIADGKPSL